MKIIGIITVLNLIIVPISTSTHFYLFLFIRIKKNNFYFVQLHSIYSDNRRKEMSSLKEWFLSNDRVKNEEL